MIVASTDETAATMIVFKKEVNIKSFEKSLSYHSKVNPVKTPRPLALLKEKNISIAIGAYKNKI